MTLTFHVNVSNIMQYLQQTSHFKHEPTETKTHTEIHKRAETLTDMSGSTNAYTW